MSVVKAAPSRSLPWYSSSARLARLLAALIVIVFLCVPRQASIAQSGWQWYKTDLHVHSVLSADAYTDLGIISQSAKSQGYNALFLTDHNLGSSFPISSLTANNMAFDESFTRWTRGQYGSPSSTINVLTSARANTGVNSIQLSSTATGSGETHVWATRGPNFRSGDIILKVSIYPTRIDPGSGVYISASIGGDVTVHSPEGYTTTGGTISPGKNTVLVWQLGSARTPSTNSNARVLVYSLGPYTLNTWNHYTVNISQYLANIPAADRPLDYNGLTYLKMAAAGNGGTASAYFDTYSIIPTAPVAAADEFVYRTSMIGNFDTSTFKIFPSLEMGVSKHAQRFNFGITDRTQFLSYWNGVDGILPAQQSGYPSMLNHPGSDGGASDQETISTQGYGADLIEARQQGWIDNWDGILQQGTQVLGTGTSDTHRVFSGSSFATYVSAPVLTFDSLIRSIFEGRTYIAVGSFGNQGRVIFNKDSSSQEPYPARYPVYVPSTQTSVNVHLSVTASLSSGYKVRWIRNGALLATDNTSGVSYDATKAIPLSGPSTYVRGEIRDSGGGIKALTQPIIFIPVADLPSDKSYYINSITTADGRKYTKLFLKGITQSVWSAAAQALTLTLNNLASALVEMRVSTNQAPQSVQVNGGAIPSTGSLTTFQAAATSMWYYNSTSRLLYLKILQPADTSTAVIGFASTGTATITPTSTPPSSGQSSTFAPVADAYVKAANPTTNYGTSTTLRTDNSPVTRSYLRFNVQGLSFPVTRATLRIFANTASNGGFIVNNLADNTWSEPSINYDNSPVPGGQIGSSGPVTSGTWTSVDVTSYVAGNGTFNFALTGASSTEISLASRESGVNAPQLVIETASAPTNTPTASPTLASTATSTNTPTLTSTATATPSQTVAPSDTSTPTDTSTNTPTPTSSPTNTLMPTSTPTNTPTPTNTSSATVVGVGMYDDGHSAWSYSGTWTTFSGNGPYNNSLHQSNVAGSAAEVAFNGVQIKLSYLKAAGRGSIDVYMDGTKVDTINANSSSLVWQAVWTSSTLTAGTHTVRFVNTSNAWIDLDALQVLATPPAPVGAGTYDDGHSAWSYSGTWTTFSGNGPYDNTLHQSNVAGSAAEVTFDGVQVKLSYLKAAGRGSIDVYMDGTKVDTINANSSSLVWQAVWTSQILSAGVHTVRFVNTSNAWIDLDAIQIE